MCFQIKHYADRAFLPCSLLCVHFSGMLEGKCKNRVRGYPFDASDYYPLWFSSTIRQKLTGEVFAAC